MRKLLPWIIGVDLLILAGIAVWFFAPAEKAYVVPEDFPALTPDEAGPEPAPSGSATEVATFGNGCFWCTEAVFQQYKGVLKVESGYTGGQVKNPTYKEVCTGGTGHAEVVQITFDPKVISFVNLLEVFWRSHDPTTLNRQGNDVGTQYRSAVFYHSERQRELAEKFKAKIDAARVLDKPVVTEITPAGEFYPAEAYHQDYFDNNTRAPYCRMIIRPKLDKLKSVLPGQLKNPGA